jgi:hypothetical protein
MEMDVVFTNNTLQYLNIKRVANLTEDITTTQLDVTSQNVITIFGYPYQMNLNIVNTMTANSV